MVMGVLFASEHSVTYFNESDAHRLLCREAEFSYRLVTHQNAEVVTLRQESFFHLIKEDIYLTATGCTPLTGKKEAIIF
jgi:hypothetical protein